MAHTHLANPDLALDKIFGTDHYQDAESFIQLIERKIILLAVMHLETLTN